MTWKPVMSRLAHRFSLIAPDLRGFGDSDKPSGPFGPDDHARDMLALVAKLGIEKIGVVGHDVGGAAMMPLARMVPERLSGLFFFDFVYPGIGAQMGAPGPPEGNLVPVIQPARARPSAGRRHTRNLQGLCRALPAPLGV
jgi:pimeloyl-ACP methyl ester carboxylesterase